LDDTILKTNKKKNKNLGIYFYFVIPSLQKYVWKYG